MGIWDSIVGGIGKLFGGGGSSGFSGVTSAGKGVANSSGFGGGGGGGIGNTLGSLGKMFTGSGDTSVGKMIPGLATMFGSQLIGNPKTPSLGADYNQYMNMMKGGGTPGMQSANQYYQGVLSGNNQGAYDAATWSLDKSYEEEVRKLNSMYKTLRPGTDPSTDSTYQRDLNLLNQNYAQNRANVTAGVQQGAAQGAGQLGVQQMSGMQSGLQAQLDQIATQWGMSYAQKDALRKLLMGVGSYQVTGPQTIFNKGIS